MDLLDMLPYKIIIDFLEIQEYIKMFSVSQSIQKEANRYKKIRYPCIVAYNGSYGGFGISSECRVEIKKIKNDAGMKNDYDYYSKRTDKSLVQAVLTLGSKKSSYRYSSIRLHAVPLMFKDWIKIDEYDGSETPCIDTNRYRCHLIDKYKKMADQAIDGAEKKELESVLFQKLIRKHDSLNQYIQKQDPYMDQFNDRLDQIIDREP